MRVLVIGGGGREHAIAWKVAQSARVEIVWVAPGNAGTASEPKVSNVPIDAEDIDGLLAFARERQVDLSIVGPEAPLVAGLADRFEAAGLRVFGPGAAAARLEGSKDHAKRFLRRHGIATADYQSFEDADQACAYIRRKGVPIVIKADGLAAGKGVTVAMSLEQATLAVRDALDKHTFGEAGRRVVIEEFLAGEEASFICMIAGEHVLPLASSQDHKARDDADQGPNTGGMGAYSPAPIIDDQMHERIMATVIEPTVRGLRADGVSYTGFLYAGLMIDEQGIPKVLEFNCRLGDPETQPILYRLRSDLVTLCERAIDGKLDIDDAEWDPHVSLGVVLAAGGYPSAYRRGDVIAGLPMEIPGVKVFHAGTRSEDDKVLTNGGRVLCVCAKGETVSDARQRAYQRVATISWPDVQYRNDIGYRAIERECS